MQVPDRITVALRAPEGATLEQLLPFIQPGVPVAIGHGLAVIAARSDRDALEDLRMVESQLVLAEAAIKRSVRPGSGLRIDDWIATVQNARRYECCATGSASRILTL